MKDNLLDIIQRNKIKNNLLDTIERLTHLIVYLSDYRNVIPTKDKVLKNKVLTEISDISKCLTRTMESNRHSSLKFAELSLESAKDALIKNGKAIVLQVLWLTQ